MLKQQHLSPTAMCSAAVSWARVPLRLYATASVEPAGMCPSRTLAATAPLSPPSALQARVCFW